MPTPDHVLSLTLDPVGVVHLHADKAGLDCLILRLQRLRNHLAKNECDHDHLMSEDWGGHDLSQNSKTAEADHHPVHHLKIFAWTDEWAAKQGFK